MKRVGVLFGGRSVEHEISILTALEAMNALDTERYEPVPVYVDLRGRWWTGTELRNAAFFRALSGSPSQEPVGLEEVMQLPWPSKAGIDIWMPLLHGTKGEDGCIQGLFELAEVPYTGCSVRAAAVGMSKPASKLVAQSNDVPVLPWHVLPRRQFDVRNPRAVIDRLEEFAEWPLFIKPANLGSSVGVARVTSERELLAALVRVFRVDDEAMIEPCVTMPAEINVSVRRDADRVVASVVEMPIVRSVSGVLTFDDKYVAPAAAKGSTAAGMGTMARVIDPPDLPLSLKQDARSHACTVYEALGCDGVARIDFLLDSATGALWFNEINTLPGSLANYLWSRSQPSVTLTELLASMIEEGERRWGSTSSLNRSFGFRVLR